MNIKEIAKLLGISTTTVSNVIHGKTREVSATTILKVEEALEKYNYIPNITARNLAQNESKIIGVAMRSNKNKYSNALKDPFVGEFIGGVEKYIRQSGYFMMLYISEDIEEIIRHISLWNVDGLILLGIIGEEWKKLEQRHKKPTVFIDSYFDKEIKTLVNIGLNDFEGTYRIGKYLISMGHRKIAFFSDNMFGVDLERVMGLKKALDEEGVDFDLCRDVIIHRLDEDKEKESYESCCERAKSYTAICCASDFYAVRMIKELQSRGMHVPNDISVTGFDDNLLARIVSPALTTVHQDLDLKSKYAVEALLQLIASKDERDLGKYSKMLDATPVIRESVRNLSEKSKD